MIDVEEAEPALLPEREADHAAELDQLRLVEMPVHPFPERVVRIEVPGDRFRVGKRRLLALGIPRRLLEIEEILDVVLDHAGARRLYRALVAAVVALDRAGDVQPAQLLDRVI